MNLPASGAAAAAGSDTADYRNLAHQILSEDRFRPPPLPRPLHGALDALGGALAPIGHVLHMAFSAVARLLPGGTATVWVLLAVTVIVIAATVSARVTHRRLVGQASPRARIEDDPGSPDARSLEAAADAAERDGRFEQAVRLRFQSGLLRLDELGLLSYRPSLPNAIVSRRLGSPIFDALARRFEEVAYGGRQADPADVGLARDAWKRVLSEARRR